MSIQPKLLEDILECESDLMRPQHKHRTAAKIGPGYFFYENITVLFFKHQRKRKEVNTRRCSSCEML